jgi:ABC-2 type transport system permease protein
MIKKIFAIAFLYLKTTFSSRSVFIFSLAMPLLFTFVLGQAIGGGSGPDDVPTSWPLDAVDLDRSAWSERLLARLEDNATVELRLTDLETAAANLESEDVSAALVIPAGFGAALDAGENARLELRQGADEIARAQILAEAVGVAAAELSGSLAVAEISLRVAKQVGLLEDVGEEQVAAYREEAFQSAETGWAQSAPVVVEAQAVSRLAEGPAIPGGASQSSPGMLVMYVLFFTFGGGVSLLVERDEGTLRRLLVMPMNRSTFMAGKLLGIFLGALVQMAVMVLAGQFLFGVGWGQEPLALAAMLLAYGFTGTALGLMVAALARTTAQANAASTIAVMALSALGGAWWPIEITPAYMQQFSQALPTGWAMRGFHDIISRGLGLQAITLEAAVLVGFGLLFLLIGVWRFRYE